MSSSRLCAPAPDPSGQWLLTDGHGGYSIGSRSGLRRSPTQAVWVPPPPAGFTADSPSPSSHRLIGLDPVLATGASTVPLDGPFASDRTIESFAVTAGVARWRYRAGEAVLDRELALSRSGELVAVHRIVSAPPHLMLRIHIVAAADAAMAPIAASSTNDGAVLGSIRLSGPRWQPPT
jgi:hypothetical protein